MSSRNELSTARLVLRRWRETDRSPFAALNADPLVMEYFPDRLTGAESDDLIAKIEAGFEMRGYGLWALEVRATGEFVGFTGLAVPSFSAHFTPAIEVGWRLARSAWGRGYATEAGLAAIAFGFQETDLDEIVSFTTAGANIGVRQRHDLRHCGRTRGQYEQGNAARYNRSADGLIACFALSVNRPASVPDGTVSSITRKPRACATRRAGESIPAGIINAGRRSASKYRSSSSDA